MVVDEPTYEWPREGWRLLIRQPDLDSDGLRAWLAKHERYQYNVTVWVDAEGTVVTRGEPQSGQM